MWERAILIRNICIYTVRTYTQTSFALHQNSSHCYSFAGPQFICHMSIHFSMFLELVLEYININLGAYLLFVVRFFFSRFEFSFLVLLLLLLFCFRSSVCFLFAMSSSVAIKWLPRLTKVKFLYVQNNSNDNERKQNVQKKETSLGDTNEPNQTPQSS